MDKRDEAVSKLNEAYALMKSAGIAERFLDLAEDVTEWKEFEKAKDDGEWEYFKVLECSICNEGHNVTFMIRKDVKHNWQHTLEFIQEYRYRDWSFWSRLVEALRSFGRIFFKKKDMRDILIKGDDLTKFKDLLKKLP